MPPCSPSAGALGLLRGRGRSCWWPPCPWWAVGRVKVKMLPFDNKSEFKVHARSARRARRSRMTAAVARSLGRRSLKESPRSPTYEVYAGTAAPFNFVGMVRHYFLRQEAQMVGHPGEPGAGKERPQGAKPRHRSAPAAPVLDKIAKARGARIKVVEIPPPGPPVLDTLVAEVYGPTKRQRTRLARQVETSSSSVDGVVDVDCTLEATISPRYQPGAGPGEGRAPRRRRPPMSSRPSPLR